MEKLNIAEILKDCPSGMELDCTMYDNVQFDTVQDGNVYPIKINTPEGRISLSKYGCYSLNPRCKCVIFPKDKTTWEGFQRPFKAGDVLIRDNNTLCIYKSIHKTYKNESFIDFYCGYRPSDNQLVIKEFEDSHFGFISEAKLATEEEKQKLFDAIKANGYKWNPETKTLEKLVITKFKVGDIIQDIDTYKVKITEVNIEDEFYGYESMIAKGIGAINFSEQDDWKLVPNKFDITTLKAFDRVLVRDNDTQKWTANFFSFFDKSNIYPYSCVGHYTNQCIPYDDETKHLLGTTNKCDDYFKTWE